MNEAGIRRRRFGEVRALAVGAVAAILFLTWWGSTARPVITRPDAIYPFANGDAVQSLAVNAGAYAIGLLILGSCAWWFGYERRRHNGVPVTTRPGDRWVGAAVVVVALLLGSGGGDGSVELRDGTLIALPARTASDIALNVALIVGILVGGRGAVADLALGSPPQPAPTTA